MVLGQFEPSRHGPPAELSPCRGVGKFVQAVQVLDAFSSISAVGGERPGSSGCWGSPGRVHSDRLQLGLQNPA